jgi:hypothetical protein
VGAARSPARVALATRKSFTIDDYKSEDSGQSSSDIESTTYTNFINYYLSEDLYLSKLMPLKADSDDIITKMQNGLILIRLLILGKIMKYMIYSIYDLLC